MIESWDRELSSLLLFFYFHLLFFLFVFPMLTPKICICVFLKTFQAKTFKFDKRKDYDLCIVGLNILLIALVLTFIPPFFSHVKIN